MTNSTGFAARVTQENILNNNIIIDTVPPLLYLYGVNNTVSYVGSSYVDAGAISYDISYGIQDVTGASTVDTSTAGTYDVTYDALMCVYNRTSDQSKDPGTVSPSYDDVIISGYALL